MGILRCQVSDCERIMCDRYSYTYGYICDDHFEQLVRLGPSVDLDAFFEGTLDLPEHDEEATRAYYDTLFRRQPL